MGLSRARMICKRAKSYIIGKYGGMLMNRAVLLAFVLAGTLTGVLTGPAAATAQNGARVDLNLYYDEPVIAAGGTGGQTFTVVNSGADASTPADLIVTNGVFVGTDPAGRLFRNCGFLYREADPDLTVPQVIRCTIPALHHGESASVRLPLAIAAGASAGSTYGTATVLPEAGSPDVEQHMADNLGFPSVVVTDPSTPAGGPVTAHVADLYLTTDLPAIATGAPAPETLTVGNRGPQRSAGPIRLVVVTPPLVRVDEDQPMPAGCGFSYNSPVAGAPQIIRCTVDSPLPVGGTMTVRLPLAPVFGSPVQTSWGSAGVFPDRGAGSIDIDPVPANNVVESGVQVIG
jgi:hypothetical protein